MTIAASPLHPYSAVLVASYGGPDGPEDVLPFMRNATAGKNIPDERLLAVAEHYMMFGGTSPINVENAALARALRAELANRGLDAPVVIGNRNWHPFHAETVADLVAAGHTRVLGLPTSAYHSYSGCRQYGEDLERAMEAENGRIRIDRMAPFALTEGFIKAQIEVAAQAFGALRDRSPEGRIRLIFATHSIPLTMNEASGGSHGGTYHEQHLRVASNVTAGLESCLKEAIDWDLAYSSRSGPARIPWLEPDVNDLIAKLPGQGVSGVVVVPIGFISDHMEVVFDLDTEASASAADNGLEFIRAATVGTNPTFIAMIVDQLIERAAVARGEASAAARRLYSEGFDCCHPRPVEAARARTHAHHTPPNTRHQAQETT